MNEQPHTDGVFQTGHATHVGHVRSENEDSYLARPDIGVWAVADGMGGHEAGAFASAVVVETLSTLQPARDVETLTHSCLERIDQANAVILDHSRETQSGTIGTTVAALLAVGRRFACVWCGDSRIYRIRDDRIDLLTRDHTQLQEFIDSGVLTPEEATNWPNRNVLTRAVGVMDDPMADSIVGEMKLDDIFVVCSDGLTGHVSEDEIRDAVGRRSAGGGCAMLIDLALSRGGKDNVTVVIVHFKPEITRNMPPPRSSAEI